MNLARTGLALTVCLGMGLLIGCTSSKSSDGGMSVHLVDGPISGYQEINVHIQSVQISTGSGWTTLGAPDKTINLLSLTGGVEEMLASGASLPAGTYQQMRLILGSGNTAKLADGTVVDLKVPSGLQTGIKLNGSFTVQAGTTEDVFIDFDAAHSIQIVGAGASGQYLLRPTVRAFDKVVTGSISGTLTDAGVAGLPLAGAMVYAETLDGTGNASIARSAVTDANGHYMLDLLPVGATYYVVSQPLIGSFAYGARASGPQSLTSTSAVMTYNASFPLVSEVGGVSGALTPVATADQSDAVSLLLSLDTGSGAFIFIARTTMAAMGVSTETYGFTSVPAGAYFLKGTRTTLASDGSSSSVGSAVFSATVTNGTTTTVDLTF